MEERLRHRQGTAAGRTPRRHDTEASVEMMSSLRVDDGLLLCLGSTLDSERRDREMVYIEKSEAALAGVALTEMGH